MPGGGVEPNEDPANTAIREVLEEAGVVGTLGRCLGMFEVRMINKFENIYNVVLDIDFRITCISIIFNQKWFRNVLDYLCIIIYIPPETSAILINSGYFGSAPDSGFF